MRHVHHRLVGIGRRDGPGQQRKVVLGLLRPERQGCAEGRAFENGQLGLDAELFEEGLDELRDLVLALAGLAGPELQGQGLALRVLQDLVAVAVLVACLLQQGLRLVEVVGEDRVLARARACR